VSKEEVFEILDENEKEGLLPIASTSQAPQFVCSCCDCCCGPLQMMKGTPRPVDFSASNFQAHLDPTTCNGCKKCQKRCRLDAITYDAEAKRATSVNHDRCVGCGVCVTTCKTNSLRLERKHQHFVPPKDHEELYDVLMRNKKGRAGKLVTIAKMMMGREV
jgi:Na+-translocating ferredoxin:NAD+ oxidoreductase RNF subunit RnfB